MKICALILASFMACPMLSYAQQIPLFQFTLHFEDSIGNQDSIVLGNDPTASSQHLNPQFGEAAITNPFDSVFEVRAIHPDDSQQRTLKVVIGQTDTSTNCEISHGAKIVINARFPPIKITYDSTLFLIGTCGNVILSPEWNIFFLPEWWNVCEYHCLAGSSMYLADLVVPPPSSNCWNHLFFEKEVEGMGVKPLPGLFFITFFGPGPCNDPTFLAIKDAGNTANGNLSPNPVGEHFSLRLHTGQIIQATISDVSGRVMVCPYTISGGIAQFDASNLLPGLYMVFLQEEQGRPAVYKFLKM